MTLPPFKEVRKEAKCPTCFQILAFSLGKNFKKHAYFQCSGPPEETQVQEDLLCDVCLKKFKQREKYLKHLCKRQQPSPDSAKYTRQFADGPLRNILLKADEHELYELCFSQVHICLSVQSLFIICSIVILKL